MSEGGMSQGIRRRGWWYEADWIECPRCRGTGENVECYDDLCHAQGRCMHGDNLCALCEGHREITRELEGRWYNRDSFEAVTLPDADLRARRKLHAVARERYRDTDSDDEEADRDV